MSDHNKPKIVWSVAASRDIIRLRSFIEPHNQNAARRAAEAIKKAPSVLMEFPLIGKSVEGRQEREISIPFGKRGYIMRYRLDANTVVILRIWHDLEER
ncbi:MAG: type II toxin-antitoxin system RelE/ParE family toxin [Phycisphaerae bacterium]|nr:type II toxin-antitoxin system RelE/ParE family toxin [Phycisphaerae bacterium]